MGPATLDAASTYPPEELIARICDDRLSWLQTLGTFLTFGKGWTTRVKGVKRDAISMVPEAMTLVVKPEVPSDLGLPGDVKPETLTFWDKTLGVVSSVGLGSLGVVNNPYTLTFALVLVVIASVWAYRKFK